MQGFHLAAQRRRILAGLPGLGPGGIALALGLGQSLGNALTFDLGGRTGGLECRGERWVSVGWLGLQQRDKLHTG